MCKAYKRQSFLKLILITETIVFVTFGELEDELLNLYNREWNNISLYTNSNYTYLLQ